MAHSVDFGSMRNGSRVRSLKDAPRTARSKETSVRPSQPAVSSQASKKPARGSKGLHVERCYTKAGSDPLDGVVYERRSSTITNPDGSVVFKMEGAEVPASWSQLASDILMSKYFRKAGLNGDKDKAERSIRQVVRRLAHTIRAVGESYFANKAEADAFEAEL